MKDKSPFTGKTIIVYLRSDDCSHDLTKAYFEEINGRQFITGTVTKQSTESGWVAGKKNSIAWDEVEEFYIFDTHKEYIDAVKISHNYHKNDD